MIHATIEVRLLHFVIRIKAGRRLAGLHPRDVHARSAPWPCLVLVSDEPQAPAAAQPPTENRLEPSPQWKPLARSLWFDPEHKQLIVRTRVVLRAGPLEHLLCLKGTKEHEAILATDAAPRADTRRTDPHRCRGGPSGTLSTQVRASQPAHRSPSSSSGRLTAKPTADARSWVKDEKNGKSLAEHWVFAGSELFNDPVTKKTVYLADEGDLITVANFGSAILDLPLASSANDADRVFAADTAQVPPLGTEVFMRLGPVLPQAKK